MGKKTSKLIHNSLKPLKRLKKLHFLLVVLFIAIFTSAILFILNRPEKARAGVTCNGVSCDINTANETTDVVISNTTISIAGHHRFKSLRIINNGVLTHPPFLLADPSIGRLADTAASDKKVSLEIVGDLTLDSGGKINADGKGYPGGYFDTTTKTLSNGFGPGGSNKTTMTYSSGQDAMASSGGAGSYLVGGQGRNYNSGSRPTTSASPGGKEYTRPLNPFASDVEPGSGGSGALLYRGNIGWLRFRVSSSGSAGGGRIMIKAGGNIKILDIHSKISANGADSSGRSLDGGGDLLAFGGAGSGGYVYLSANKMEYIYGGYNPLNVSGGKGGYNGWNGKVLYTGPGTASQNYNVEVQGGSSIFTYGYSGDTICSTYNNGKTYGCGGGGSGGVISITAVQTPTRICKLVQGATSIPPECEGEDVIIDGTSYVDPTYTCNKYGWCTDTDPNDNVFTVDAGAVKVLQSDSAHPSCNDPTNPDCNSKRHFNSLTINKAVLIHSKVDSTDMAQDLNGDKSLADETVGDARWKRVDIEVMNTIRLLNSASINVDGKGYPGGQFTGQSGYGPGGGQFIDAHDRRVAASGGGHGGFGGTGFSDAGHLPPGNTNDNANNPIDFGSGGGHARESHSAGNRAIAGGSGGGRIFLKSSLLDLSNDSNISAKGSVGGESGCGDHPTTAMGGSGSGGSIWIDADSLTAPAGPPSVLAGSSNDQGINGNGSLIPLAITFGVNISAQGGNSGCWASNAGGGGRIFIKGAGSKVTVTLKTQEVNDSGNLATNLVSNHNINITGILAINDQTGPANGQPNGQAVFYLPNGNYTATALAPPPAGFETGSKSFIVNNAPLNVEIILYQQPKITGDIYGKQNVSLKNFKVQSNSIIAAGTLINNPLNPCATGTTNCKRLNSYSIDWNNLINKINSNESSLAKEKAFAYTSKANLADTFYTINSAFNLNSPTIDPASPGSRFPEGGVWKVPGDLKITNLTYNHRGTIIVQGDLEINGNITASSTTTQDQLGLIVDGSITINGARLLQAAIYSKGSITIANRSNFGPLVSQGFLVSQGNIVLPTNPAGSQLTYFPFLSNDASKRALPGFGPLKSIVFSQVAP